jgi:hypothetical protein
MNRLDDDTIKEALRDAHAADQRATPEFEGAWKAAEEGAAHQGKGVAEATGIIGGVFALAAGIAVIGFVGLVLAYASSLNPSGGDRVTNGPVEVSGSPGHAPNTLTGNSTDDPFDAYDIVDWQPETDALLAQDNRMLEPLEFGDPTWGSDDWDEFESTKIEEL